MYAKIEPVVMWLVEWTDGETQLTARLPVMDGQVVGFRVGEGLIHDDRAWTPLAVGDWAGRTPVYECGNQTYRMPGESHDRLRSWPADTSRDAVPTHYVGGRQCVRLTPVPALHAYSGIDDTGTHREVVGTRPEPTPAQLPDGYVTVAVRGNSNNCHTWHVPAAAGIEVIDRDNDGTATVRVLA